MKKRFGILSLVLSGIGSALGFGGIYYGLYNLLSRSTIGCAVLVGAAMTAALLGGFWGMRVGQFAIRQTHRLIQPKTYIALALIGAFLLGACGQLVFGLERKPTRSTIKVPVEGGEANVIILLDGSDSMADKLDDCRDAIGTFLDSLNESISAQCAVFSYDVKEPNRSALLPMTGDNKGSLKSVLQNASCIGGTEYNAPLAHAIATLEENRQENRRSVILLVTDGASPVDSGIKEALKSGIDLITVRLNDSDPLSRELGALATKDIPMTDSIDGALICDAFWSLFGYNVETIESPGSLGLGTDLIFDRNVNHPWRTATRIVMLALFSLLAALAYYGKPNILSLLLHPVLGVCCALVYVADAEFGLIAMILSITCAYTIYEITAPREVIGNV